METTAAPSLERAPFRRAHRPADRRILGGVAAGLAEHLGVGVVVVRTVFVVATFLNGAGAIAYLVLWRLLPLRAPEEAPGLEAAARTGLRSRLSGRVPAVELVRTLGIVAVGVGAVALLATAGVVSWAWLTPLGLAVGGVALIWRQLDDAGQGRGRLAQAARFVGGALLVAGAVAYVVTRERGWAALGDALFATVAVLAGLALILGPWVLGLLTDLGEERRERIRSQERADVAAHLHDSVLQTLALLQKNAHDAAQVATLARRQERDLRAWLYGEDQEGLTSFAAALRAAAAEVEEAHRLPVEVVVVGDAPLGSDLGALVAAAREAVVNAAKHAGVDRIDVYAECAGGTAGVFVRDRGVGFDPNAVAEDRMGLRGSIVGRVERHGGTVEVRTAPGEGTEIRLSMPLAEPTVKETP